MESAINYTAFEKMGEELFFSKNFDSPVVINDNGTDYFEEPMGLDDPDFSVIRRITDITDFILFALSIPSFFANIFVLWASRKLSKKTSDPTHLLVASMTAADLILCANQDLRIIMQHFLHSSSPPLVIVHMFSAWTGYSACGLSLLFLNIEKMLYFHWPLHYDRIVTPCKTLVGTVSLWIVCVSYSCLMLAFAKYDCDNDYCIIPPYEMFLCYMIVFCTAPVLSSGLLSIYLWCTVRSKRVRTVNSNSENTNSKSKNSQKIANGAQLKTVLFIFTTSIWVMVSWIPARLYFIFFLESTSIVLSWFGWCTNLFLLLSPLMNPLLTVFVYPCYRKLAQKCVKCKELISRRYHYVDTNHRNNCNQVANQANGGCTYTLPFDRNLIYCPNNSMMSIEESNV